MAKVCPKDFSESLRLDYLIKSDGDNGNGRERTGQVYTLGNASALV